MRYLHILLATVLIVTNCLAGESPKRVLLVTHAGGYMHDSILTAEQMLKELGPKNGFELTCYRFTADPDKQVTVKRPAPADSKLPGTTILTYEIKKPAGAALTGNLAAEITEKLKRRIDPSSVHNIIWRPHGDDRLEIELSPADVPEVKRLLKVGGVLEFHVLAYHLIPPVKYQEYVEHLKADGPRIRIGDEAKWFEIDPEMESSKDTQEYNKKKYVLGFVGPGDDGKPRDLTSHTEKQWHLIDAAPGKEVTGETYIRVKFDAQGGEYLGALTAANISQSLAIVLDGKVIFAPVVNTRITSEAVIYGGRKGFSDAEAENIVGVLNAGSLPAQLSDEPVSERSVGPMVDVTITALEQYSAHYQKLMGEPVTRAQCGRINAQTLKNFDAVIFFTTSTWKPDSGSHPLTEDELHDLLAWVNQGGAFVAVHCGSDTLHNTPYGDLVGGTFGGHPWLQKVRIHVEDPNHPAGKAFADGAEILDEIYQFGAVAERPKSPMVIQPYSREKLHIITSIDPTSIDLSIGARPDHDYASSWCHMVGQGRSFYTALGHHKAVWLDPRFQQHLLGGLKWAMGELPGDATPSAQLKK